VFEEPARVLVSPQLRACCDLITQHQHKHQHKDQHEDHEDHLRLVQCVNSSAVANHKRVSDPQ
jgi:hypothetical protein